MDARSCDRYKGKIGRMRQGRVAETLLNVLALWSQSTHLSLRRAGDWLASSQGHVEFNAWLIHFKGQICNGHLKRWYMSPSRCIIAKTENCDCQQPAAVCLHSHCDDENDHNLSIYQSVLLTIIRTSS